MIVSAKKREVTRARGKRSVYGNGPIKGVLYITSANLMIQSFFNSR